MALKTNQPLAVTPFEHLCTHAKVGRQETTAQKLAIHNFAIFFFVQAAEAAAAAAAAALCLLARRSRLSEAELIIDTDRAEKTIRNESYYIDR